MWKNIEKEQESTEKFTVIEVDKFERKYGVEFSDNHKLFLSEFGQGLLYNHVRIFGLRKIERENKEFQNRWSEYYLWENPNSALSKDDLSRSIIVGDTFNGDEFVITPGKDGIFFLPQGEDCILCLGADLEGAINKFVEMLQVEVAGYDEEDQEEWYIRPVFNIDSF